MRMSTLRITDAPLLPDVNGTEKIPTGGRGDYAVSIDQIKNYAQGGVPQQIEDHINDTSNPHQVTKDQVGLGNVDNTSDIDKPVSVATQEALDLKANLDTTYTKIEVDESFSLKADKSYVDSQDLLKANKTYVDTALSNLSTQASKFYPTLAEANADIANIAVNQAVQVGETTNGGLYYKATAEATTLTKSPYDPLTQSKAYSDANRMFNPIKIGDVSLDTLTTVGIYQATDAPYATLLNKYPAAGLLGIIRVTKASNSSYVFQEFTSKSGVEYYRELNTVSWTEWKPKVDLTKYPTNSLSDKAVIAVSSDINNFKTSGIYTKSANPPTDFAVYNYPVRAIGWLTVFKSDSSSVTFQKYLTITGTEYTRYWNGSVWSAWVEQTINKTNYMKLVSTFSSSMNANDLNTEFASYIVNNSNLNLTNTNLPRKGYGILNIYKGTSSISSFGVQEFLCEGQLYTRYWNATTWSVWTTHSSEAPPAPATADSITFTKTADELSWFLANSSSGTNLIKHLYKRTIRSVVNLDSWGMNIASKCNSSGTVINNLTTNGVWEVAIVDSENVGDHSGGSHGDEVKSLSYFLVDGIYKDESFTGAFVAEEVKHVQHSTIFVEATSTPICRRETVWTFNKDGCTSKTRLIFDTVRTIKKARIAMLPILRKANEDGTGVQITDTEIRSQDNLVKDVSVHNFTLRDLPISDGDSILLSSEISGISALTVVNKINSVDPHAYVQKTLPYNKLYINAFEENDAVTHTTTVGEVWEADVSYIFKAI